MYFKLWTLKPGNLGIMAGHSISWLNFAYPIAQALSPISDGGFKGFLRYCSLLLQLVSSLRPLMLRSDTFFRIEHALAKDILPYLLYKYLPVYSGNTIPLYPPCTSYISFLFSKSTKNSGHSKYTCGVIYHLLLSQSCSLLDGKVHYNTNYS